MGGELQVKMWPVLTDLTVNVLTLQIPAVQRNVMSERPATQVRVLTQLGAIRKQLQLEQMELDNTYVKHSK